MKKSHFNDEFLALFGPIISRLLAFSNEEKKRVHALVLSICYSLLKKSLEEITLFVS
jgi:hypothetical protein